MYYFVTLGEAENKVSGLDKFGVRTNIAIQSQHVFRPI